MSKSRVMGAPSNHLRGVSLPESGGSA
jgi:hypothetical protein